MSTADARFADELATHRSWLVAQAASRVGPADAQDIAHDVLCAAWQQRRTLVDLDALAPWLQTVLARRIANEFRRRGSLRHRVEALGQLPPAPDSLAPDGQWGPVADVIESLPERFRAVVFLVAVCGLSQVEVAEVLSVPYGTVTSRWQRAQALLRDAGFDL